VWCSLIVNCAGPVSLLQDRVAQAALRARCHYVDLAGMSFVKERLCPAPSISHQNNVDKECIVGKQELEVQERQLGVCARSWPNGASSRGYGSRRLAGMLESALFLRRSD
jgi:hypothetical protein